MGRNDGRYKKTSATKGIGIDELLEHLDYAAEVLDLKADPTIPPPAG
jgi:translation initiation factor IF-2